jgi:hypothetical protein
MNYQVRRRIFGVKIKGKNNVRTACRAENTSEARPKKLIAEEGKKKNTQSEAPCSGAGEQKAPVSKKPALKESRDVA